MNNDRRNRFAEINEKLENLKSQGETMQEKVENLKEGVSNHEDVINDLTEAQD